MHKLLDGGKLIVGFDLGNTFSQISFCDIEGKVESVSLVAGEEEYNIPTALCKRIGVNQWYFGNEAKKACEDESGIYVDGLLELAMAGEEVLIDEKTFDPIALLTLYVKRALSLLPGGNYMERIGALMFTCEKVDSKLLEVIGQIASGLKLKEERLFCQSHTEGFYNYMIHQPDELWQRKVLLCEYAYDKMKVFTMECNRRTQPIVAFIDSAEYAFTPYEPMPEAETLRKNKFERLDEEFLHLTTQITEGNLYSSVFLIGNDFDEGWMNRSLKELCRGRRVFQGSNLYCKGACLGMLERIRTSDAGKTHVFLGNDKLKANVGMELLIQGKQTYFALLDAGINWFEVENEFEFYLQDGNELCLTITPLMGGKPRREIVVLEEFDKPISRMKMKLWMKDEKTMKLEISDLGFGNLINSEKNVWNKEINIFE